MRIHLVLLFILIGHYSLSQDSVSISKYTIGEDTLGLHLTVYYPHTSSVGFINLHDDENTSVEAGIDFISKYGGSLLQLQHSGKRRFTSLVNADTFSFDPNRIFTESGIRETLTRKGIYQENAAFAVKNLADSILKNFVDDKKLVIALHNTRERGLSILSYIRGGFEYKNAARVYMNRSMDPHDFVLTTEAQVYHHLKRKKINVVLQHPTPGDDGSLSVYAARKKIPYINVEALHGHFEEQVRMLEALKDIIFRY